VGTDDVDPVQEPLVVPLRYLAGQRPGGTKRVLETRQRFSTYGSCDSRPPPSSRTTEGTPLATVMPVEVPSYGCDG
jgi:hypothetical protein